MLPEVEPQAKRLKRSANLDVQQAVAPEEASEFEDCLKEGVAMEAISEEEDKRILDLEAEVEELREQVHTLSVLHAMQRHDSCLDWTRHQCD